MGGHHWRYGYATNIRYRITIIVMIGSKGGIQLQLGLFLGVFATLAGYGPSGIKLGAKPGVVYRAGRLSRGCC